MGKYLRAIRLLIIGWFLPPQEEGKQWHEYPEAMAGTLPACRGRAGAAGEEARP